MTAHATPPDWDSIARYLAGESSGEEAAIVRAWLDANPKDRDLVDRLNSVAAAEPSADIDVDAALARVHGRMSEASRPGLTLERNSAHSNKGSRYARLSSIAVAAAAAAAVFAILSIRSRGTSNPGTAQHFTTGVGRRDSLQLADGSTVILGPQSTLDVPADYGRSNRAVTLTGDGYFDVKHDASKAFSVHVNGAVIEDIGTTFTVESDAGALTSVAVVSGSVRLRRESGAADAIVLSAGDRGSIGDNGAPSVEHNAVRDEDTAWVKGRLAFRDAPLSRVSAEIERWYGVKMRVADSALGAQHITTSFEGESVDQALRILGLTMGAKIERRGDSAIVSPARGSTTPR